MPARRLSGSLALCLCIAAVFTSCQYHPSSLARTEVPLYIPPMQMQLSHTSTPANTQAAADILATETKDVSTPTLESEAEPECQLATDPDYGYSADMPIQVGSNQLSDGQERELIYLLTLRGPNGEEVFYSRQSPQFNQDDTIVDPYLIEYAGIEASVTLYLDLYNYAPLLVPIGFTCEAAFPIQPPQE